MSTATHYPLNLAAVQEIVDASGTNPIVAALCSGYVRSAAHQYADDLTGELSGSGYARAEIATPTLTADGEALVLSGTDPEFASFTGTFDCIVFLEDTGVAATSRLLAAFSIAPTTITADTYAVDLPADGILRWTPVASTTVAAAAVSVDATGFTGNLSGTDTDVQTALETIDALDVAGTTAPDVHTIGAFLLVDQSYGDPATVPVALLEGSNAYFFSNRATGDTSPTPWAYAGLYEGHAPDLGTPTLPTRAANQPVPGSFYLTRGFYDFTGGAPQLDPLADDSTTVRFGYVSPINGVDKPVFALVLERYTDEIGLSGALGAMATDVRAVITTAADWPEITVDSAGDPLVNGGLVKLQEIFDVLGARAGGGVSLGETSITAYRGDRGKTAYDHSQTTTGNPHGTTPAEITGFDTAVRTSRLDQMAAAGADVAMGSHKITGLANGASSTDAAAFGQIPTASSSTPAAPGTAAAGSSTSWAKGDHVHPYQASVIGGQDEGTSVTSTTDTSLLDAAIFISGQSTGDTVVGWFTFSHTNTSGSGRTHSIKPKLGATTLGTLSYNCPSGATTSGVGFFVLRSEGASDHNFGAAVFTSNSGVSAFQTVTTENLSTGADLDLLGAIGAGGSQTNTLQLTSITRHRA